MLVGLRLKNIAIIDALELSFDKGFSVFTGETGAGKSILLDSIDALLGGGQPLTIGRLLREGAESCSIEATFLINDSIYQWLEKHSFFLDEDELVLMREWKLRDSRFISRFRLNGEVINKNQILSLRPLLIDFTAQGHAQKISDTQSQLFWLDRYGSHNMKHAILEVQTCWKEWNRLSSDLIQLKTDLQVLESQRDEMKNFLDDIDSLMLDDPAEDRKLEIEQDRLVHGVRLQEGLSVLFNHLKSSKDSLPTVSDQLAICMEELKSIKVLDNSLDSIYNSFFDLSIHVQDLVDSLEKYNFSLESEPEQLANIQSRISQIKQLKNRYSLDLPELIKKKNDYINNLDEENTNELIDQLFESVSLAEQSRDEANQKLSNLRKTVASELEQKLENCLISLGLKHVRFHVEITSSQPTINGSDNVKFLFSPNPGQPLAPINEIASGGEMSRFLLALKTILSTVEGASTLIFDEIDSGVSGRISSAIAELLRSLSVHRQVFCVTHQPLLAAVADNHFSVSKIIENGSTITKVSHLNHFADRQNEIALLAGGDFTEAKVYAASLLEKKVA